MTVRGFTINIEKEMVLYLDEELNPQPLTFCAHLHEK